MFHQEKTVVKCPNCKKGDDVYKVDFVKDLLFFCNACNNGFLYPIPKNLFSFYPPSYWKYPGQLSYVRSTLHNLLRVKKYIRSGNILDVGAGEGVFGKMLGHNFKVTNLESPHAKVSIKNIVKIDFLKWKTNKKFDGIVFLESLEHVPSPQEYLRKAKSLLKKGGYIFVECPRYDSWESKLFKDKWLHLDIPRHLAHLTRKGLGILALRNNLRIVSQNGMLIYEFSPYCFIVSLIRVLNIKPLNLKEMSISNLIFMTVALILLPIALVSETIFHFCNQDPVEFSVFRKV